MRKGALWHDGSSLTPADVVWSLERADNARTGSPIQFVWGKVGNFRIDGKRITRDILELDPTLFERMAFLTGCVLPKHHNQRVGSEGFERQPIGSGPYKVDTFERNAFVRRKAFDGWWGGRRAFATVVIKFATDPVSRVAEIESGQSDVTLKIP